MSRVQEAKFLNRDNMAERTYCCDVPAKRL